MSQDKEREAFGLGELDDLLELHKRTSEGMWSQGMTSHHTVAKREGSPDYQIAEFHHADDASFVDAAHKYMPRLIELTRAALAAQPPAVQAEPLSLMEKVRLVQKHLGELKFAEEAAALALVEEVERKTAMKFVAGRSHADVGEGAMSRRGESQTIQENENAC